MSNNVQNTKTDTKTAPSQKGVINKPKKKKKGHGGLIFLVVLFLIVSGAAALLYFNVYNIKDMVFDALRNVPLIGGFIPVTEKAEPGRFDSMTTDQIIAQIERLERQVNTLTKEKDTQQETINAQKREIERLQGFEEQQEQFKEDLINFNAMVAGEKPLDFWDFYQKIYPDQAYELAREASGIAQDDKEIKRYLSNISGMDEKKAAEALEDLLDYNDSLARDIMKNLSPDIASAILDNMIREKRSVMINLMSPPGGL